MTELSITSSVFETPPIDMHPMWLIAFQAPQEDVQRIFDAVAAIVPLGHGKTDQNGYRALNGVEYYRPLEGTPTGAEESGRRRPDVDEMRFFLPRDREQLRLVIEAIYQVHSYYEPVIIVTNVLRSHSKGVDDRDNPHRWWNKQGDWKKS